MPKSVNKVILIGNLGKPPEVKYTPQGTAVCQFSLATSSGYKDKQTGEWKESTEWHNIQAWGKLAEICSEYLHKGSKVYLEGHLKTESWDDKQHAGVKRYMTKIVAEDLVMLSPKQDGDGGGQSYDRNGFDQSQPARQQSRGGGTAVTEDNPITDEDIPF